MPESERPSTSSRPPPPLGRRSRRRRRRSARSRKGATRSCPRERSIDCPFARKQKSQPGRPCRATLLLRNGTNILGCGSRDFRIRIGIQHSRSAGRVASLLLTRRETLLAPELRPAMRAESASAGDDRFLLGTLPDRTIGMATSGYHALGLSPAAPIFGRSRLAQDRLFASQRQSALRIHVLHTRHRFGMHRNLAAVSIIEKKNFTETNDGLRGAPAEHPSPGNATTQKRATQSPAEQARPRRRHSDGRYRIAIQERQCPRRRASLSLSLRTRAAVRVRHGRQLPRRGHAPSKCCLQLFMTDAACRIVRARAPSGSLRRVAHARALRRACGSDRARSACRSGFCAERHGRRG